MGNFGEQLKREREMRGVSLDEISTATRIAPRFLEAIESEQWGELPGGVFNRGFVRAVAHYLGLDEEKILADYGLATGDGQKVPVWTGSPPAVTTDRPWLLWLLGLIVAIVIIAGGWYSARRIYAWRVARRARFSASTNAQPNQPAADVAPVAEGGTGTAPPSASSVVSQPEKTQGATATATPPAAGPAATAAAKEPFDLTMGTTKNTHVSVMSDSHRVFNGGMKTGQEYKFSAEETFQITAHDAGVLHVFLNGKSIPPIGRLGHSAKVTLTRDALHEVLKDQSGVPH